MPGRLARVSLTTVLAVLPSGVFAQPIEALGTRAAGMAGAFVAVADDASAVYWNPAALASGSFFGLVLDQNVGEGQVPLETRGRSHSATLLALGTPPLGLSYYRLQAIAVAPPAPAAAPSGSTLNSLATGTGSMLVTHHVGVTLVQSLVDGIAVGTTLKLVHGTAGRGRVSGADIDELIDAAADLAGAGRNAFDADIGVMAIVGSFRAGLTLRNVAEPEFETADGTASLVLKRQTRAGVAYHALGSVLLSADIDLERASTGLGEARNFAMGAEARVVPRAFVRGGVRFNTVGDQPGGRATVASIGGSFQVLTSLLVDGQVTLGSEAGARGWGIAGRVVF